MHVNEHVKQISTISFDDFIKVEMIVGTIEDIQDVPKSNKLLKLSVNFGPRGVRQILSGIKEFYKPEELKGKQGVFVFNFAPRMMMGLESHGMLLTAESPDGNEVKIVTVDVPVPNGSMLR